MTANLSGQYRLDLTLNDVIEEALDILQAVGDGEPISGASKNRAIRSVNTMLKLWESQGIHLWTLTEGSLFMRVGQAIYDFDNTGKDGADTDFTHLANEFTQTALTTDLTAATNVVTLDDVSALEPGDLVGVVISSGDDLEWQRAIDVDTGTNIVTTESAFVAGTNGGSIVYTYHYDESTAATAPQVATDTELTPADISIFNIGDAILIELDTVGTSERNEVTAVGATAITLLTGLTDAVSIGNNIVNLEHRNEPFKPIKRIPDTPAAVRRRESNDYEIPIVFQSRDDYFGLPNKNQQGTPIQAYYSRQQPAGIMYLWNPPISSRPIINFTYERELQIFTDVEQTFDLPEDWFDAVTYNLAVRLIPKFGCSPARVPLIKADAQSYLDSALAFDQAVYPIRLMPQKYG